jgi:hypothetical protein
MRKFILLNDRKRLLLSCIAYQCDIIDLTEKIPYFNFLRTYRFGHKRPSCTENQLSHSSKRCFLLYQKVFCCLVLAFNVGQKRLLLIKTYLLALLAFFRYKFCCAILHYDVIDCISISMLLSFIDGVGKTLGKPKLI